MSNYYNKKWFLFLLIFPFFNPTSLKYIPGLILVYDSIQIWKLIAISIIIFSYFIRRTITPVISIILLLELASVFTSIINNIYDSKVFTNALLVIGISMLTELAIKINFKQFSNVFISIIFWLIAINCFLCIAHPDGLRFATLYTTWKNPMYFLGIDNAMIKDLLPLMVFMCYAKFWCDYGDSKRLKRQTNFKFYLSNLLCIITLFTVESATGLITYLIFTVLIVIYSMVLKKKIPYRLMIFLYALFLSVVIVMGSNVRLISTITGWFGRSNTFTGRASLWSTAVNMILQKPFTGFGYTSGNINMWGGTFSSHNLFLELLLQGGVIYFILFVMLTFYALKNNSRSTVHYGNFIFIGIFSYLLIGLVETGINTTYFILIVMACYPDLKEWGKRTIFKF